MSLLWRENDRCSGSVVGAGTAKRFFRRLLKGLHDVPRVIVTDKP